MKSRYLKKISHLAIASLISISLIPSTAYASGAEDYVEKFQSMDFQEMMNSNFSNNLDGFSEKFSNSKNGMLDKFNSNENSINKKIKNSLSNYKNSKGNLSDKFDNKDSNLTDKFENQKSDLKQNIKSNMSDTSDKFEDNSFLDMFKKEKKENKSEIGGNTPSGLTGFGTSYGGSGGSSGFGGLPSLNVGPEKRGEISSTVKSMSSKYEDWSAPPAGLDISSSIQTIQENTELAQAGFDLYQTSQLRDYTDDVKDSNDTVKAISNHATFKTSLTKKKQIPDSFFEGR